MSCSNNDTGVIFCSPSEELEMKLLNTCSNNEFMMFTYIGENQQERISFACKAFCKFSYLVTRNSGIKSESELMLCS